MTPYDDNDLIAGLKSGIAERQSGVSVPDGLGDAARRAARRRTATRVARAGVPALAVAGVATVLATSGGSGTSATGNVNLNGPAVAPASGGSVSAQDTAYIVKRVKAHLTDASQGGTLIQTTEYAKGSVSADGTLSNLSSWLIASDIDYTAADGSQYSFETMYNENGSTYLTMSDDYNSTNASGSIGASGNTGAAGAGASDDQIEINPSKQLYSRNSYPVSGPSEGALGSDSSTVRQAIQSGQVTQVGRSTANGTPAIVLSVKAANAQGSELLLYVDAQNYQPLQTVQTLSPSPSLTVSQWMPATSALIAKAETTSIPSGYTEVSKAQLPGGGN